MENHESSERRWRSSMVQFLAVELESAKTLVQLAARVSDARLSAAYRQQALKAYETVLRFSGRMSLLWDERLSMDEDLEFVKSSLQGMGAQMDPTETDPVFMPVLQSDDGTLSESVARFLEHCQEFRATAARMTNKNRQLISQTFTASSSR